MSFGPIEGSPIPLLRAHEPLGTEVAAPQVQEKDAVEAAGEGFLDLVVQANERNHSANYMAKELAAGRSDDIHGTMIEFSKAGIETRLVVSVRDKVMEAFHEIWRMSV